MKRYAFLTTLVAACAAIGFTSYRIGRDQGRADVTANAGSAKGGTRHADTAAEPDPRPPAELLSLKQTLKHGYAASTSSAHDWILRGQTAAVLATMTTDEVKGWLDELMAGLRAGSVVKAGEPDMILASDLLREWGRRDPVAACAVIKEMPRYTDGRMAAFQEWLSRDPWAVERWMNSGGEAVPIELRKAWLSERVKTNPVDAIQQLTKLPPEERESSLLDWSTSFALLPGERKALLDAVREEPALLRRCAGRVAAALADRSVEEAYAFVDTLDLPAELAASIDDGIFVKWGMKDPQEAFAEWAKQQPTRLPENFLYVLDNWSLNSPGAEQAIKWLDTVQAGTVKEQIQTHFIAELADGDRFEQALRMCVSMENREEGKRQAMRVIATLKQKIPGAEKGLWKALKEEGMDLPGEGPTR